MGDPPADGPPLSDILSTSQAGPAAVRGGALRVGSFLIGALASAGSAALLFRHLGQVGVGQYVTILSLVAIVGGVSDLGLTAVGIREASVSHGDQRSNLIRDLLGLRVVLTAFGTVIILGFAAVAYSHTVLAGVAIASLALLTQATQDNYAVILQVNLRFGWVAALETIRQVLTAAFMGVLVIIGARLLAFVSSLVVAGAVVVVIAGVLVRSQRSLLPSFDWQRWRRLVRQILPYSAATAAGILYFRMAIILTSLLAGEHQLDLFSASFRVIEVLYVVPGLLATVALPIFSRAARDDLARFGYAIGRVSEVALIVGAWVAVSIGVGASLAMSIIGGPKFHDASGILAIEGVALGAQFVGAVWANGMLSLALNRQILMVNLALLVLSAVVIGVLVEVDGARGTALGTVIDETLAAIVCAWMVIRHVPHLRVSSRLLVKVALASAVALSPLLLSGVPTIFRVLLATALYGAILVLTRALPSELRALVPGL